LKNLTKTQWELYSRNISIPEIGEAGQEKLLDSRVLVVGAGGLGSPAIMYLAANGVGEIGIADYDRVELSNLQRQIIHGVKDIGRTKVESATEMLRRQWPDTLVTIHPERLGEENGRLIVSGYDFIIEATDSFRSKYAVNDACLKAGKPFTTAGILSMYGQVMTVLPGKSPCYRCVFKEEPAEGQVATTSDEGVLGSVPGVVGAIQATEAIKYITRAGTLLTGRLLTFDALDMVFREVPLPEESRCGTCGETCGNGD
jgi:molybdopterin/thiamine biosynthesis adenylyltransferase